MVVTVVVCVSASTPWDRGVQHDGGVYDVPPTPRPWMSWDDDDDSCVGRRDDDGDEHRVRLFLLRTTVVGYFMKHRRWWVVSQHWSSDPRGVGEVTSSKDWSSSIYCFGPGL